MNDEHNKLEALKRTTSPLPDVGFNATDLANRSLRLQGARIAKEIVHQAAECAAEVLWPTRCALCDRPGSVLCPQCESSLHFIDAWQACPRCGAPFGRAVCTECNPVALKRMARRQPAFRWLRKRYRIQRRKWQNRSNLQRPGRTKARSRHGTHHRAHDPARMAHRCRHVRTPPRSKR